MHDGLLMHERKRFYALPEDPAPPLQSHDHTLSLSIFSETKQITTAVKIANHVKARFILKHSLHPRNPLATQGAHRIVLLNHVIYSTFAATGLAYDFQANLHTAFLQGQLCNAMIATSQLVQDLVTSFFGSFPRNFQCVWGSTQLLTVLIKMVFHKLICLADSNAPITIEIVHGKCILQLSKCIRRQIQVSTNEINKSSQPIHVQNHLSHLV
mmetsp:Transcript_163437/g.313899  ORF Transcript_163437/g.313899 Transcript_163437/m.313899 type:complete len:212 (+) Transcript_163437:735-1370(+)